LPTDYFEWICGLIVFFSVAEPMLQKFILLGEREIAFMDFPNRPECLFDRINNNSCIESMIFNHIIL